MLTNKDGYRFLQVHVVNFRFPALGKVPGSIPSKVIYFISSMVEVFRNHVLPGSNPSQVIFFWVFYLF